MTVCIIPARFNSSRFPGKLLKVAVGQTVLQRTFRSAQKAKTLDQIFIATDDERIAEHAQSFGCSVLWTPNTCKNGTERIAEALLAYPELQQARCIVNLQGDHPLTSPNTLDSIAKALLDDLEADVATAVRPIRSHDDFLSPHVVKCVLDSLGRALYFSRAPIPYGAGHANRYQHIGIYAYRTCFLLLLSSLPDTFLQTSEDLEQLKFLELGYRIKVAVVEDCALGVDTPNDLLKLEHHLLCQSNTSS
jgi:3-deoxy-manno-octulosonate cytidylyltransferase (CMP-KDO synthetase)